jgi:hypothetical protein
MIMAICQHRNGDRCVATTTLNHDGWALPSTAAGSSGRSAVTGEQLHR